MIQEYYLHMFCGVNGEYDQNTSAGRIAIATLMSGFGLAASTKKDLQERVGWRTTPGCFLGQKELQPNDHYCRNYEETRFAVALAPFRKVNRTMNYQLDWSILNGEWNFDVTSPMWIPIAKIYWLGYMLFGRNVIPETAIAKMHERFSPRVADNAEQRAQLDSPFVMQFMRNINLPLHRVERTHLFSDTDEGQTRFDIFGSLILGMNFVENSPGFYAAAAMIPVLAPTGFNLRNFEDRLTRFQNSRVGKFRSNYMPLGKNYYYNFGMGSPALPNNPSRMPGEGRNIVPLLFCNLNRTPQEEAASHYAQIRGQGFNITLLMGNIQTWMTAAILYEYHLMLTGEELFPLSALSLARTTKEWTEEHIINSLIYLNPANSKNSSVAQIVRFNLERQLQV